MRIVLFGCQQIAKDIIDFILTTEHDLVYVIEHDEERDRIFGELVGEHCRDIGISTIRFTGKIDADFIRQLEPEIIFSIYYRKILSPEVITIPRLGCINVHPGLLPKFRGCNPTYWNIINAEKYAGSTMHYMTNEIDNGNIIAQKVIDIGDRNGFELNRDIMKLGVSLFKETFTDIVSEKNKSIKQDDGISTYFGPYRSAFKYINWNDTAEKIICHIRAHHIPYEGSMTCNKSVSIRIDNAYVSNAIRGGKPAGYFYKQDNNIVIQTNTAPLIVEKYVVISGKMKDVGIFISGIPE